MTPGLNLRVENTLKDDGSEIPVALEFKSMEDFEPAKVAGQVEPLSKLLETRDKLKELLTKVDLSPDYEEVLQQILENTENLEQVAGDLGVEADAATDDDADSGEGDD
jgi:type VI secretion system protein ImpB